MKPTKEELTLALESIKNEYDGFYMENKYGKGTHYEQFVMLNDNLVGTKINTALGWIQNCYDCYYKHELEEGSAFDYLQGLIDKYETN